MLVSVCVWGGSLVQCWWDQALVQPLGNSAEGPRDPEGMAAVRLGYHFWVFVFF